MTHQTLYLLEGKGEVERKEGGSSWPATKFALLPNTCAANTNPSRTCWQEVRIDIEELRT